MAATNYSGPLAEFAKSAGLAAGTGAELPRSGSLLSRGDLQVEGAAHGKLPGDETGTIGLVAYTTRSDDTTTTHRRTAVVLRVPESIGYAPYLQIGGGFGVTAGIGGGVSVSEPAPGLRVAADEGIDKGWLTELFSPAFAEWLSRSPDDFGAELANGVLVVVRDGHVSEARKLDDLCRDAARIAGALREESIEEAESGGGSVAADKPPTREHVLGRELIPRLGIDEPPPHVGSALGEARRLAVRSPRTWAMTLRSTLLWMLGINIIGGGIYGLLLNLGDPLKAVLVYQVILLVVVGMLVFRSKTGRVATHCAEDAFYDGYAEERSLRPLEPLRFAAENAEANLPGRPVRVFEGSFGGKPGALMLTGDGRERGQQVALVRGRKGPTAIADLDVPAPGMSAAALDGYVETLVLDLETAPPQAAAAG